MTFCKPIREREREKKKQERENLYFSVFNAQNYVAEGENLVTFFWLVRGLNDTKQGNVASKGKKGNLIVLVPTI